MKWEESEALKFAQLHKKHSDSVSLITKVLEAHGMFKHGTSVLSIGGGSGLLEVELIKNYLVKLSYVDPSHNLVESFIASLNQHQLNSYLQELYEGEFQSFETASRYDLILCIHAWQYLGYDEAILKKALSLLKPDGKLCIVLTSEKAFSKDLKDLLYPEHGFINYEELSRWASKLGYPHESTYAEKIVPLSQYIVDDKFTEDSKILFSLLARKEWEEISDQTKEAIKSMLTQYAENETLDDGWGMVVF